MIYKGTKQNWLNLFDTRHVTYFECDPLDGEPTCNNDPNQFGFYFVCQGPIDNELWTKEELENHHNSDLKRKECKAYSFCHHSSMALFNYVLNNKQQFECCRTKKRDESVMIKFAGCDHAFTFAGLKEGLDHKRIENLLVRNINENKKYFGEYFISCPQNCEGVMAVYALKGFYPAKYIHVKDYIGSQDELKSESKKEEENVLDESFYGNRIQEILNNPFRTCCDQECKDKGEENKCYCVECGTEYCYCGEKDCSCPLLTDSEDIEAFLQSQPGIKLGALYNLYITSGGTAARWENLLRSCGELAVDTWENILKY